MKNTIRQVFHSPKFVFGFCVFMVIILIMFFYPLINPGDPLAMIGQGTFTRPGTYVSVYDAVTANRDVLTLPDAEAKRLTNVLDDDDRQNMITYFEAVGIDYSGVDMADTDTLLAFWKENFDDSARPQGMQNAMWKKIKRLNTSLENLHSSDYVVSSKDEGTEVTTITGTDYARVSAITNTVTLPLGTDNFGRDMLKELVSATATSLMIGLIAGSVATLIGLILGLLSGYCGGVVDDIISFVTNVFTVIPGFVLLILISYSIGQDQRGAGTVAVVIGLTGWTWTTRGVRAQVISLRNRDHVNLSKLSGHSLPRIIVTDVLPYIASYVVMAFILQVSSGILSEAQLSMLGLGPKTTEVPTLGLMMQWAMKYKAHTDGAWWAYFPIIFTIALISFSLNLMNTGLDQVFNPTLRD